MKPLEMRLRCSLFTVIKLLACFSPVLASQLALTQTPDQKPDQTHQKKIFTPETDLSVGIYGQLTNARTPITRVTDSNGTDTTQESQGTSDSPGVVATFHQSLKPWLGYNVNFGYSRFSENYSYGQSDVPLSTSTAPPNSRFSQGSIPTNMLDLTIAYLVHGPSGRRFSTFAQFGGGGLFFLPTESVIPENTTPVRQQTRPAMVFGVGMNYSLTNHLALRAEYRGFFYKSPDFTLPDITPGTASPNQFPMTRLFTVTNTPAVSLVYRFGGAAKHPTTAVSH